MILDSGICSIFRKQNIAVPGEMPKPGYVLIGQSWYGELNFETSPAYPTEGRKETKTDARIRILQDRNIQQNDVVVLLEVQSMTDLPAGTPVYRITRAYHGTDENTASITDLSLEVFTP